MLPRASLHAVGMASLNGQVPYTTIFLRVKNGCVEQATFQAFGCGVTIAACSALTELVCGKPQAACRLLTARDVINALDGIPPDKQFCAQLAINALKNALDDLNIKQHDPRVI